LGIKRSLVLSDLHIPFHCNRALDLALSVGDDLYSDGTLDEIILNGDIADFYGINQHGAKDPEIITSFYDEVSHVRKFLRDLRSRFQKSKIIFIEGNHCYRLARFCNKVPELSGILDTASLLFLGETGINFIPYAIYQKYQVLGTKLIARHEPFAMGLHCAHSTLVKAGGSSVIFGHTHRIQSIYGTSFNGTTIEAHSVGWLGDKNQPVFSYIKGFHNWQQGFSVITLIDKENYFIETIPILDQGKFKRCMFNGYIYDN